MRTWLQNTENQRLEPVRKGMLFALAQTKIYLQALWQEVLWKIRFLPQYAHCSQRVYLSIFHAMKKKAKRQTACCLEQRIFRNGGKDFCSARIYKPPVHSRGIGDRWIQGQYRGEKYNWIITDFGKNKVKDILPSKEKKKLAEYFRKYPLEKGARSKYSCVTCEKITKLSPTCFPTLCWCRTNIIGWEIIWMVDSARKHVQKDFPTNKRLYFKRNKYIQLVPQEKLNIEDGSFWNTRWMKIQTHTTHGN